MGIDVNDAKRSLLVADKWVDALEMAKRDFMSPAHHERPVACLQEFQDLFPEHTLRRFKFFAAADNIACIEEPGFGGVEVDAKIPQRHPDGGWSFTRSDAPKVAPDPFVAAEAEQGERSVTRRCGWDVALQVERLDVLMPA